MFRRRRENLQKRHPEVEGEFRLARQPDVEGEIRKLVHLRKPHEVGASNLDSLVQRVAGTQVMEIDNLITELQTLRAHMRNEGQRLQREIAEYAQMNQAASKSMRIIADGLAQGPHMVDSGRSATAPELAADAISSANARDSLAADSISSANAVDPQHNDTEHIAPSPAEGPLTRPARVTRPGPAISQGTGGASGPNPAPLNTPAFAVTRLCPRPPRGPYRTPPAQGRGCAARTTRIVRPRQKMKELDEALAKKLNSICRLGGYDIARH
jgi:hypothetical protein